MATAARKKLEKPARRVLKAPAVRRGELVDAALRLFLSKGYEKTTINDVIAATRLSKGAFYHHFRAKEDLLEEISRAIASKAIADAAGALKGKPIGALERLNALFGELRGWKTQHMGELRALFANILMPENAVLYDRITSASIAALTPILAEIIEQGANEGVFTVEDSRASADSILWFRIATRPVLARAMEMAASGAVDEAVDMLANRLRAEAAIIDRILGLPVGSVDLMGPVDEMRTMTLLWRREC